ncbi:MAG: SGNH/GDSL hydrolase family protein [Methyloligellaceae bacterium]
MNLYKENLIIFTILLTISLPVSSSYAGGTVVALGASNTYGYGVSRSESYPAQLQKLLRSKGVRANVLNKGISGHSTEQMLKRLSSAVPKGTRLVILQPGGNDYRQGYTGTQRAANIREITQRLKKRRIKVMIMRNSLLRKVGRRPGNAALDRIHLTPKGYKELAREILPQVVKYVR